MKWDLSILYDDFDESFTADYSESLTLAERLGGLDLTDPISFFANIERLLCLHSNLSNYSYLRILTNSNDEKARLHYENVQTLGAKINAIKEYVSAAIQPEWAELEELKALAPYFCECLQRCSQSLSPEVSGTVSKLRSSGSYAWQNYWTTLDANASAELELDGKTQKFSISVIRSFFSNNDEALRLRAFHAEQGFYGENAVHFAACINAMAEDALSVSELRGFASVREHMLFINKLEAKTLDDMLEAIEEFLPKFRRFYKKKAQNIGRENGLRFYDLFASGTIEKRYSFAEAQNHVLTSFENFHPELFEFASGLFAENALDSDSYPGKSGGALCADLAAKHSNRIFLNYNGSFSNMTTIAHELGHALHHSCMNVPMIMRDPPTPICETASTFLETVFQSYMKTKSDCREQTLSEALAIIMEIYSRYLFEHELFARRKNGTLSASELCALMSEAQLLVFGDCMDKAYTNPYVWANKVHFYITDYHYYNFPYIFGFLLAKGLYALYLKQPIGFFAGYKTFLGESCTGSAEEVAAAAGITLDKEFWRSSLRFVADEVDELIGE